MAVAAVASERAEVAQPGRAPPCQGGCRGFKSRLPLHAFAGAGSCSGPARSGGVPHRAGRGRRSSPDPNPARDGNQEVRVSPRVPGDRDAVERAVAALIRSLGLDPAAEPELNHTPARVAGFYAEIFSGLDPANEP